MSQTKTTTVNKDTTVRRNFENANTHGAGACKRYYVGRHGNFDYDTFIRLDFSGTFWDDVGKIVSAVLTLYTDDGLGLLGEFVQAADSPRVWVRRLTSSFSEGSATTFESGDYTNPSRTTSDGFTRYPSTGVLQAHQFDITALVEDWAPKTVKRRDGTPGGALTNHGIGLMGTTSASQNWAAVGENAESGLNAYKPVLTLTYEYGLTAPNTPTNLVPSAAVASIGSFQGDFADVKTTDQLRYSQVQVYTANKSGTAEADTDVLTITDHGYQNGDVIYLTGLTGGAGLSSFTAYSVRRLTSSTLTLSTLAGAPVDITTDYTQVQSAKRIYDRTQAESNTAILNDRFDHVPSNLTTKANTTYQWRGRVKDQEGQWSAWTALTSFSVTNTDPSAPTLTPASGSSYASLDSILFKSGTFSDANAGDYLLAYQIQMSAYPEGDANWDDDEFILWNTGKRYVTQGATNFEVPYGGASLDTGTYYWRARVWDNKHGVSNWTYATIDLTADFVVEAQDSVNSIQLRPRAPWRIVIKDMGASRGPGDIVAIIEDAYNVGASLLYNSPGEAHWTLSPSHPQISVIEPKQTHYAIEFRQGDGWREVFAGLVDDFDATDQDVIFYGKDYLALLDACVDDRYDPSNPDKAAESGGSKYVTDGQNSIGYIVRDQLVQATGKANSPVGFIGIAQSEATLEALMAETVTIYSTYQQVLPFISGLLNSHRAGTGKRTRISVQKTTAGGYQFVITDDPGQVRDNLRLAYGELVQGYRVVAFGSGWGTRVDAFGRDKDGLIVRYDSQTAPGIDEAVWGRWSTVKFFDGITDANDLKRKTKQAAVEQSKLGRQVGLGLRSGVLQPRDGYDLCDIFPVSIEHGPVSTAAFGSGYWVAVGITWTAPQQGDLNTVLTLLPREDTVAPDTDLLILQPISPQAEWQIGWVPPDPLDASSRYWYDVATGITYEKQDDGTYERVTNDPRHNNLVTNSGFEITPVAQQLSHVWTLTADWATALSTVNLDTSTGTLNMTTATY